MILFIACILFFILKLEKCSSLCVFLCCLLFLCNASFSRQSFRLDMTKPSIFFVACPKMCLQPRSSVLKSSILKPFLRQDPSNSWLECSRSLLSARICRFFFSSSLLIVCNWSFSLMIFSLPGNRDDLDSFGGNGVHYAPTWWFENMMLPCGDWDVDELEP